MRKKIKWIVMAVVVLVIVFAPVPVPHFTEFANESFGSVYVV